MIKFDREHGVVIRDEEDEFQAIMASERREALSEGQERGIAIGEARGLKRGENKKTIESIRNMKSMGFEDNIIMQALNTDEYTLKNALSLKM